MYSALLFNKPLVEVTYEDLCSYFTSANPESQTLEFKSYVVKGVNEKDKDKDLRERVNDLLRTICGFLNSEGGLIIWGAPKGVEVLIDGVKEKAFYGDLTPVTANIPKDQFISKIVNSITPTPTGVLYHQVDCPSGGFIYLFEVAKSLFPPHQFQHIYWMRLDGHTRAAPHHYIEALMKQVKHADIRGFIRNGKSMPARQEGVVPFVLSVYNFSLHITGINVRYSLLVDYGFVIYEGDESQRMERSYNGHAELDKAIDKSIHYNFPYQQKFYLALPAWGGVNTFEISLVVYADNCPVKMSTYKYDIYTAGNSPTPQIKVAWKEENILSYLCADSLGKTDDERAVNIDNMMIRQMQEDWDEVMKNRKPGPC